MYTHRIEIFRYEESRDDYNDRSRTLVHAATCFAQRTEAGGRENLYAGRIVHENEVVYSTRFRSGVDAGMVVQDGQNLQKITAVRCEGRRRVMHLVNVRSDAPEGHVDA